MITTNEGALQAEFSLNHCLEMFSKIGSIFSKAKSFYGNSETALSLFQKAFVADPETAFKILLWTRDIRSGAGNRSAFRECLVWLSEYRPEWIRANIDWIPEVGRWDDLRCLFGTFNEKDAAELWAKAIENMNILAAKWADRSDKPLRKLFGFNEAQFRRLLANIRKNFIVEHKMSTKQWNEIDYKSVPSVAMSRYTNAFKRNDETRFEAYKESLVKGETKINAGALFPHDCVRTVHNGDRAIADAQFEALPNFLEGTNEKIIVLSDTSRSMDTTISGSVRAIDISQGLALYCSAKINKDNPFYKKFIGFESESSFKDWNGLTFSQAVNSRSIFDGACGSTRIDKALMLILSTAKFFNLHQGQLPSCILIISDMQFHQGAVTRETEIERCMKLFEESGYNRPKIVYWNTAGYAGSPDTMLAKNVALVSGFSPSILKAIFNGDDFSPLGIMMRTLEKYTINNPYNE